jgi:hypothetical protein
MNTEQDYAWRQIAVKDTPQLKVGDRVRVIKAVGFDFMTNCTAAIFAIDKSDDTIKVCLDNDPNGYWVDAADFQCEILPPTPKWIPIDKDNLPSGQVAFINNEEAEPIVYAGWLTLANDVINVQHSVYGSMFTYHKPTHYIPLSDLLNLPIAE